jgi:hypothetical protein
VSRQARLRKAERRRYPPRYVVEHREPTLADIGVMFDRAMLAVASKPIEPMLDVVGNPHPDFDFRRESIEPNIGWIPDARATYDFFHSLRRHYRLHQRQVVRQREIGRLQRRQARRKARRDRRHPLVPPWMGWGIYGPGGMASEWPPPYGRAHHRATHRLRTPS